MSPLADKIDLFVRWFFNVSPEKVRIEPQPPRRRASPPSSRRARSASPKDRRDARPGERRGHRPARSAEPTMRPGGKEEA